MRQYEKQVKEVRTVRAEAGVGLSQHIEGARQYEKQVRALCTVRAAEPAFLSLQI